MFSTTTNELAGKMQTISVRGISQKKRFTAGIEGDTGHFACKMTI